ncbi:DUF3849 domain-containing protein [uncultured Oscillibacter sp.]|jgi:hypothetical protein|uniref:DUF3849 domain-containing protein n=1 Tax=uncultured Oscillibacter sp. TaxID=876091 RepID=UPI002611832E|nr:DUF3849 domain-containing protein [uncultured Oscillibacter sp.]
MDKTPVYQLPFDYAQAHDECAQYNASLDANIACKEAIETAIGRYYGHNRLGAVPAVRDVVKQFGYERTLYVLANTVQRLEHDGRISRKNKEWAWKTPFGADPKCAYFIITNCHPGLLNIFLDTARHEYLLSQPIKRADIKAEASHILEQFQEAVEPNSPNGTHFMARVSPDFWARAKQKDRDRLMNMLPFASLSLSTLEGYKGIYALISKDEDRSKPLILRKPSVRKKLREAAEPSKASGPSKNREPER